MEQRSRPPLRRRAVKSCDRCRRQKLKCDSARPCLLCVHSGSKCETTRNTALPTETAKQRRPARQRLDAASRGETTRSHRAANEQPSTNASAVNFARQVFNEAETGRSLTRGVLPGDTGISRAVKSTWSLKALQLPPDEVMWVAIDAYFSRMHWLLGLVHEPSLRANAKRILASATWEREDMANILLVLTVVAVGLKAALVDPTWAGHTILRFLGLNGCDLMKDFVSEIHLHLLDVMEDSNLESVQVCMLLSSLYGYHDSPSFAWTLARMAINAAIYLELYKVVPGEDNTVLAQIRHHTWNSIVILDTYTSVIYGRPVTMDATFARLHTVQDPADMRIDTAILSIPAIRDICDTSSASSFYTAQFRLYSLIRSNILSRSSLSRSTQIISNSDPDVDQFEAATRCANESEILLRQWHNEIPSMYRLSNWMQNNRREQFTHELRDLPPKLQESGNTIILQAASLQITYDGALILIYQPLLQSSMDAAPRSDFMVTSIQKSFRVAVEAAHRISRFPVRLFQNHYAISFIYFHLFTAGVILCLVPPVQPFGSSAQEAKAGVVRIIQACRAMCDIDRTAKYTEELLADLLSVTTIRETRSALKASEDVERSDSLPGSWAHDRADPAYPRGQAISQTRSSNIENLLNTDIEDPSTEAPLTVQHAHLCDQPYSGAPIHELPNLNAIPGSIDQAALLQAHAPEQSGEAFGVFGTSMLNLLSDEQPEGWSMEDIPLIPGPEMGETGLFE